MLQYNGMPVYKVISHLMWSHNQRHKWEVGEWYSTKRCIMCAEGFHFTSYPFLYMRRWDDKVFVADVEDVGDWSEPATDKGKTLFGVNKGVARRMKLVEEVPITQFLPAWGYLLKLKNWMMRVEGANWLLPEPSWSTQFSGEEYWGINSGFLTVPLEHPVGLGVFMQRVISQGVPYADVPQRSALESSLVYLAHRLQKHDIISRVGHDDLSYNVLKKAVHRYVSPDESREIMVALNIIESHRRGYTYEGEFAGRFYVREYRD